MRQGGGHLQVLSGLSVEIEKNKFSYVLRNENYCAEALS
jgi:hypothetical protein